MLPSLDDLRVFTVVARERSFTRAAALLGLPQSSVSRIVRLLEERVGAQLLRRTTRSVSTTEAGERLLATIGPAIETIDAEVSGVTLSGGELAGNLRLTMVRHAFETILRPVLSKFLRENPKVTVEVAIDDNLSDIVSERFDAGIRFGGLIEKDMVAVRVGQDVKSALVASPAYLAASGTPKTPRDLTSHKCINYRLATSGGLYRWWFQKAGKTSEVRVTGSIVLNDGAAMIDAALDGLGIAYTFNDSVREHIIHGKLVDLLTDWCPTFPGYHIYYPDRRQTSPALKGLIAALRSARY